MKTRSKAVLITAAMLAMVIMPVVWVQHVSADTDLEQAPNRTAEEIDKEAEIRALWEARVQAAKEAREAKEREEAERAAEAERAKASWELRLKSEAAAQEAYAAEAQAWKAEREATAAKRRGAEQAKAAVDRKAAKTEEAVLALGAMLKLLVVLVSVFLCVLIYFVPTVVGWNKRNKDAIFVLNFFLGWTFLGWVIALVWATCKDPETITYNGHGAISSEDNKEA
jgi:uncharacterized protein YhaN